MRSDPILAIKDVVAETGWAIDTVKKYFPWKRAGRKLFILRSEFERVLREGGQNASAQV